MLDRTGETTPPCGAPLNVAFHTQSSRYPALSICLMSRRNRLSLIFSASMESMTSWSRLPKTVGDVSLDEPGRPGPGFCYLPQSGMAASAGAEAVRAIGEGRFVVCLQQQAHHFTDQLIRPGR